MTEALNSNFLNAANKLSETITSIYPNNPKPAGKCRVAKMKQRTNHKKGANNAPFNRTKFPHGTECNGVSIRDVTRYFSDDEWGKLTHEVRSWLHGHAERKAFLAQKQHRRIKAAWALIAATDGGSVPPANVTTTAVSTASSVTNTTAPNRAGVRFGRGAHGNTNN